MTGSEIGCQATDSTVEDLRPRLAGADPLAGKRQTLAEFRYESGSRVMFSFLEDSGDYSVSHESPRGETLGLLANTDSILRVFLAITPVDIPVPERLRSECALRGVHLEDLLRREVVGESLSATELDFPLPTSDLRTGAHGDLAASTEPRAGSTCWDETEVAPVAFHSNSKRHYAYSRIANRLPEDYPAFLWVRHRLYYKRNNEYRKQADEAVVPGSAAKEQIEGQSAAKWRRRVIYDMAWGQMPGTGHPAGGLWGFDCQGCFHD